MKRKTAAIILVCTMLLALLPAADAAAEDYRIVIKGGQTSASMETIDGESLLRVDIYMEGITDNQLLTALSFDLNFDSAKIGYVTSSQERGKHYMCAVNASGTIVSRPDFIINANNADQGKLRIVFASDYGCRVETGKPMLSLYFWLTAGLSKGTKISFTVGSEIEAESVKRTAQNGSGSYVQRTVGTSLTAYTLSQTTTGSPIQAAVAFYPGDVQYNGKTPYVVYEYKAHKPRVTVTNTATGKTVDSRYYTVSYKNNNTAGTATVTVTFRYRYSGTVSTWFKIYLPATTKTTVENRDNGIKIAWTAVEGAAGYVIYRRAWNLVDAGWTSFERWNNTTQTSWTDTKVYAGTRYQYGIKAYPSDPMDNYNLGIVGPLKTTVRITTRKLESVTAGSKKMTVKWSASKVFTGYQVQYATDASFKENVVSLKISDPKTAQTTIKNLKTGTTYYVRVRSYHVFEGTTYYGRWSNTLSCKVK